MFSFCWGGAKADDAGICHLAPDDGQGIGDIEAATIHPVLTYGGSFLFSCAKDAVFCATASSPDTTGSSYRKMWLNGQVGSKSYIPYIVENGDNKQWGIPGAAGADAGAGYAGLYTAAAGKMNLYLYPILLKPSDSYLSLQTGKYIGTFNIEVYYSTNTDLDPNSLCSAGTRPPSAGHDGPKTYTIFGTAKSSCNSHVDGGGNIVFPKDISLADMPVMSASIQVSCSDGVSYDIGWDQGNSPVSGRRGMKCSTPDKCNSSVVQYDVFKDAAATQVWGNKWGDKNSIWSGANDGHYTAYVAVYKDQSYPPAGTYKDTVVATVMVTSAPSDTPVPPGWNPWDGN